MEPILALLTAVVAGVGAGAVVIGEWLVDHLGITVSAALIAVIALLPVVFRRE
jgi:hypothetical protein